MSKERKPLLSDAELSDAIVSALPDLDYGFGGDGEYVEQGAKIVRTYYERLIDEGKLQIVKQPRRVKDGDWEHVYGPNTDLYAYSVNKDGRVEILPEMMPQLRTD